MRDLIATHPKEARIWTIPLGDALASQARYREASEFYWRGTHREPSGRVDGQLKGDVTTMTRIAFAFEEAGRNEDALWAFGQTGCGSRREAYLSQIRLRSPNAYWACLWAQKLLRENPQDKEIRRELGEIEKEIRSGRLTTWTYDVPFGTTPPAGSPGRVR